MPYDNAEWLGAWNCNKKDESACFPLFEVVCKELY
jgi:hypothetical protein